MNKNFTIGVLQLKVTEDIKHNEQNAAHWVEQAAHQGAQVICLPELYRSQYFCQKEDVELYQLAETIPGPSTEIFCKLSKQLGVVIVVPVFEKRGPGMYHNTAFIADIDGSIAGTYRKMHIPDDPAFYEKFYFSPGDKGFTPVQTSIGKIGTLICWDQWFPEGARLMTLQGVPVIFYPTAIGWHPAEKQQYGAAQRDSWITVQRGHAIANGVYVAAANRVGFEQPVKEQAGLEFWGSSFICDPQGVMIQQAGTTDEEILIAEIDLAHMETIRQNWPFLRDRRIDAYQDILKRYND